MVVGPFGGDASQFAKFLVELLLEASDRPWPHRGGTETVDQLAHACQYRFEGIVELGSLVLGGAAQVQAIACQRHTQVHRVRHSGVLSFGTVKSSLVEGKTPPFSRFAPNRLHDHCAAKHQEKPEIRAHGGDRTVVNNSVARTGAYDERQTACQYVGLDDRVVTVSARRSIFSDAVGIPFALLKGPLARKESTDMELDQFIKSLQEQKKKSASKSDAAVSLGTGVHAVPETGGQTPFSPSLGIEDRPPPKDD